MKCPAVFDKMTTGWHKLAKIAQVVQGELQPDAETLDTILKDKGLFAIVLNRDVKELKLLMGEMEASLSASLKEHFQLWNVGTCQSLFGIEHWILEFEEVCPALNRFINALIKTRKEEVMEKKTKRIFLLFCAMERIRDNHMHWPPWVL